MERVCIKSINEHCNQPIHYFRNSVLRSENTFSNKSLKEAVFREAKPKRNTFQTNWNPANELSEPKTASNDEQCKKMQIY